MNEGKNEERQAWQWQTFNIIFAYIRMDTMENSCDGWINAINLARDDITGRKYLFSYSKSIERSQWRTNRAHANEENSTFPKRAP